jgi:hypothetical protein
MPAADRAATLVFLVADVVIAAADRGRTDGLLVIFTTDCVAAERPDTAEFLAVCEVFLPAALRSVAPVAPLQSRAAAAKNKETFLT